MREVDRLRALQVRVAGHGPVLVALGELHEHALEVLQPLERAERVRAREHGHVRGHLVVARAGGVELAADRPDDLRQAPLDRHVDVLVVVAERERAAVQLRRHAIEAAEQRVAVGAGDDPGGGEHGGVGARLLDVVGPEAEVEADRRVELPEDGVLGLGEPRHTRHHGGSWRSPCAPPGPTTRRPGCSTSQPRRTTTPTRAAPRVRAGCCARSTRAPVTRRAGRCAASPSTTGAWSACSPRSRRRPATRSPPASSGSRWCTRRRGGSRAAAPPACHRHDLAPAAARQPLCGRARRRRRGAAAAAWPGGCWPRRS